MKETFPPRLPRRDCFFGVHFDFHAGESDRDIGKYTTPESIEAVIAALKPDYIQIDCKGHAGWCSYPTKVGTPSPGVVADSLKVWREVTAKRGIGLFMHYSGVWDAVVAKAHPEWACVNAKGEVDGNHLSVFGPYVQELLIPQLKELRDVYEVDGIWIDGDCWATQVDYHPNALAAFQKETGITDVPRSSEDPHYFEFLQFCREGFRRYVKTYVDELHRGHEDFQIASNWAFSTLMPEPVTLPVDFLSGDFSPADSVDSARMDARYLANQGMPWDLMAWSFGGDLSMMPNMPTKEPMQLAREAAIVLALGGGFQFYVQQRRNGAPPVEIAELFSSVAEFCRERQSYCHQSEAVRQIAVLFSTYGIQHESDVPFRPWGGKGSPMSVLTCLLDGQQTVDLVGEHHLETTLDEYSLLVIPGWLYLEPIFIQKVLEYVKNGGTLLLASPGCQPLFKDHLGIAEASEISTDALWLGHAGRITCAQGAVQSVKLSPGTQSFGQLFAQNSPQGTPTPAASLVAYGKGKIAALHFDLGKRYQGKRTAVMRNYVSDLVRELVPEPLVEVIGSRLVEVILRRKDGKLMIHLVNLGGAHHDPTELSFDEIPSLGPLKIAVRGPKLGKAILLPDNEELPIRFTDGVTTILLPALEIHATIAIG